ncbi:MAG: hypothetical protein A2848_01785 [Candidatus Magasanikbacteria bacterium RIFCSPHIGHO2_01_FULL_50_8]|uniref:Uncharacterized protein n=1 Tax=Candidatus Magasanikbacteria bacterium RIFCSPHIGHO2_01_FULL_50_8 TaxID=1798674 RepID=A0A1F6LRM9_9BACT|nr:MAG: hypothetical protein A2848_01785 [Candidatus Magasanikbacteria bacterium RIFCSPHIGHO2_01_FULL_50_8]
MSFSNVWRDYNTQRHRRYRDIPKLIALSRGYLKEEQPAIYSLIEATERAEKLKELGLALLGEQFEAEKILSKHIRTTLVLCHHHHALLAKNAYMDLEHELRDADAHLHALHSLLIGSKSLRV